MALSDELEMDDPQQFATPSDFASPAPSKSGGGFDIRKMLEGFGHMASGTAASLKGDQNYFMRLDALEEESKRRDQQTKIENRRLGMQTREAGMKAFETAIKLRELGLDDKQAAIAAKRLKPDFDQGLGGMQTDEAEIAELIRGGRGLDNLQKVYTSLPQDFFQQNPELRNKPAQLKTINEEYEKQRGKKAFSDIASLIQENPKGIDKNITRQRLSELHPDAEYMNDDQLLQLNRDFGFTKLKPAKLMEKEEEGKIIEGRQEENQQRSQEFQQEQQLRSQEFTAQQNRIHNAEVESRFHQAETNRGRALIAERREAEQNAPLDTKATKWVKPDTLEYASPDMTPIEARNAGYAVLAGNLSQAVPSARAALKTLDRYDELSKKLLIKKGDGSAGDIARIQANRARLAALRAAGNEDVKEFDALGSTIVQHVKAFGDTGNIAVKEAEFQSTAMPTFSDTQESSARKTDSRRKLLKNVVRNALSATSRTAPGGGGRGAGDLSNEELLRELNK